MTDTSRTSTIPVFSSVPRTQKLSRFPSAGLDKLLSYHEIMETYIREEVSKILKEKVKRKELIALARNSINKGSKFMNLTMRINDLSQFIFFVEVIKGLKFKFDRVRSHALILHRTLPVFNFETVFYYYL